MNGKTDFAFNIDVLCQVLNFRSKFFSLFGANSCKCCRHLCLNFIKQETKISQLF